MVIIQYGLAKSGSSFIFQILTDLFQNRFLSWSDYMKNRNSFVPDTYHGDYIALGKNDLHEIIEAVPDYEFFLFKTHDGPFGRDGGDGQSNGPEKVFEWIEEKKLKVIATVRDPRDMCLSYFDHAESHRRGEKDFFENEIFRPVDAVPNVQNEYQVLSQWTRYNNIYWISYPQVCSEPFRLLEAMKKYIGLYHIDSKDLVQKLLDNKNKIHQFNKGYVDRWKSELGEKEQEELTAILEPEIEMYEKICRRAELSIKLV